MKATANGTVNDDGRRTPGSGEDRYLVVAVVLLALVALLYGGAWWLTHAGPARPAATATASLPTVFPTVAAAVPTTALPTPARVRPASWTVTEMTDPRTGRTYYMAPPGVVAMVLDDYQETDRFFAEHTFDVSEGDYSRFFSSAELSVALRDYRDSRARGEAYGRVPLLNPNLRVLDFSANGLTVRVGEDFHGERFPVYDVRSRRLVREETAPVGTGVATMVYDSASGRWKGIESNFVESGTSGE